MPPAALLLALVPTIVLAAPADAQQLACRDLDPVEPELAVTLDPGEVAYDYGRSREEIGAMAAAGGGTIPGGVPLGLTAAEELLQIRVTSRRLEREAAWCQAPAEVAIEVGYSRLEIFVDERYPEGSCQRRVIEEHENEHVRINQESLSDWRGPIETAARGVVAGWGWATDEAGPEALAERFQQELAAALDAALAGPRAERDRRHATIDAPEAYAELTARCPSW